MVTDQLAKYTCDLCGCEVAGKAAADATLVHFWAAVFSDESYDFEWHKGSCRATERSDPSFHLCCNCISKIAEVSAELYGTPPEGK